MNICRVYNKYRILSLFSVDISIVSTLLDKLFFFFKFAAIPNEAHDVQLIKIRSWTWTLGVIFLRSLINGCYIYKYISACVFALSYLPCCKFLHVYMYMHTHTYTRTLVSAP